MQHLTDRHPRDLGFRMPPEWDRHAATWACWPFDDTEWRGHLEGARREMATLLRTIARFEPVHILLADTESEVDARARLSGLATVSWARVPLDDVWFRDNGPLFVTRGARTGGDADVSFVNFRFNAWGGKFDWALDNEAPEALATLLDVDHFDSPWILEGGSIDTNGHGVILTTRQCLQSPTRNASAGESDLERVLADWVGHSQIVWLDRGLEGDHTDGHVDTIARFTDPRTMVCCVTDDRSDANYLPMQANLEVLQAFARRSDPPMRVVELPLPACRMVSQEGERLPPTYANFYIGNGFVVVPVYGDPNDRRALEILQPLFPGRAVIDLPGREIIHGGGSFHCLTQQQPVGRLWRQP